MWWLVWSYVRAEAVRFGWSVIKLVLYAVAGALALLSSCALMGGTEAVVVQHARIGVPVGPGQMVNVGSSLPSGDIGPGVVPVIGPGNVTDLERYQLAIGAGFQPGLDAITMVAISIAENGSGDPALMSPRNRDGTFDLGLNQINERHWARCGGQAALIVPINNFQCALQIAGPMPRNWCAWSTYLASCGVGHTGSYASFIGRATAAAALAGNAPSVDPSPVVLNGYVFPVVGWSGVVQLHWGSVPGGSDLFASRGTPVVAMHAGRVTEAGWDSVGGWSVLIAGSDGLMYYYAHFNAAPSVSRGQDVAAGTFLGPVGNTGDAAGGPTHLHIGIGPTILLGNDKYGGTGGTFNAVGLLQRVLDASQGH